MVYAYQTYGEDVYTNISAHKKALEDWCEKQELNLNAKQLNSLTSTATWKTTRFDDFFSPNAYGRYWHR